VEDPVRLREAYGNDFRPVSELLLWQARQQLERSLGARRRHLPAELPAGLRWWLRPAFAAAAAGLLGTGFLMGYLAFSGRASEASFDPAGSDITAELLAALAASSFKTAGGNIDLKVARSARITLHALIRVAEGEWSREGRDFGIESGFGAVQVERDQRANELRAVIPINGGGVEVVCETSNGWIRVNPM
jgi:hypothetical protein